MVYTISTADNTIEWGLKGKERIVQNVHNILRTKKYEVPFMREMGINADYIDSTINYIRNNLTNDVIELVEKYESRATVLSVNIAGADENGNAIIIVELEV